MADIFAVAAVAIVKVPAIVSDGVAGPGRGVVAVEGNAFSCFSLVRAINFGYRVLIRELTDLDGQVGAAAQSLVIGHRQGDDIAAGVVVAVTDATTGSGSPIAKVPTDGDDLIAIVGIGVISVEIDRLVNVG